MPTKSAFDPDNVDPHYYSKDPNQHGDSDYGRESDGVGNNAYKDSTSGMDMEVENRNYTATTREANLNEGNPDKPEGETYGTHQEWDVDPAQVNKQPTPHPISDESAKTLNETSDNPSDEALFKRADATYLEEGDNPNTGYDPHSKGYDKK